MDTPSSFPKSGSAALLVVLAISSHAAAWSNGGYSADPANPDYGTHDWIAQHALEWLPATEKKYITDNLATYLYGTELPDNGGAPDGIGDNTKHHVYYRSNGALQDDASAGRASEEYNNALGYLSASNYWSAAKAAGIMSHYIVDVAVFGHVMGASTDWGAEVHHSDYEDYVTNRMTSYTSIMFDPYLTFDGLLETVTAYSATLRVAYNTTFGDDAATKGCVWMDTNYDWNGPAFRDSAGTSLNRAVNALADVLHTLAVEVNASGPEPDVTAPTVTITSPADGDMLTTTLVTVRGIAWDNVAVQRVQISTDAVNWAECTGSTSWSCALTLSHGSHTVYVRATDTSGNGNTASIRVTVIVPADQVGSPDWLLIAFATVVAILGSLAGGIVLMRRRKR